LGNYGKGDNMSLRNKRSLASSISTSIKVNRLETTEAKLLFTWLIPHCDDEGRIQGDPLFIKGTIFPMMEDIKSSDVAAYLNDLVKNRLINWYEVDGEKYIQIEKWEDFQTFHAVKKIASKIPKVLPSTPNTTGTPDMVSTNTTTTPTMVPKLSKDKLSKDKITMSHASLRLSNLFFDLQKQNNKQSRLHNCQNGDREQKVNLWADDIDKLIRIDKQAESDIEKVIRFCTEDDFEQANVMSGYKLRKRWDSLIQKTNKFFATKNRDGPIDKHKYRHVLAWAEKEEKRQQGTAYEN
jgi:hypothetical protein